MLIQRRCKKGNWHDKSKPCPCCGEETSKFNKSLRTAMLNNHLFKQADSAP